MIKLDENLLLELGLGDLPKEEKTAFLKHMYETLEMHVGTRLAERMSDAQMVEFEQFINSNDEQGAFQWLEHNFPNYKDVVAEEFEKLKGEIQPLAPQIVASSQAAASQAQPQPQMETQPLPQSPDMPYQPQPAPPAPAQPPYPDYAAQPPVPPQPQPQPAQPPYSAPPQYPQQYPPQQPQQFQQPPQYPPQQ